MLTNKRHNAHIQNNKLTEKEKKRREIAFTRKHIVLEIRMCIDAKSKKIAYIHINGIT